ncbi:MAG: Hpt domain-containing protein [Ruminococcaceae bacterium]|nr:Hpt domain-containing protein [Oscillospiraceae bacterium]
MNIIKLAQAGINYEEGVKRFAGKTALYEKCLLQFTSDCTFSTLASAVDAKDADKAFRQAHNLYGTLSNLSINSLAQELHPIVETLRGKNLDGVPEKIDTFSKLYAQVVNTINDASV